MDLCVPKDQAIQLQQLPTEIIVAIISFIDEMTALESFACTSKQIHSLASKAFNRSVTAHFSWSIFQDLQGETIDYAITSHGITLENTSIPNKEVNTVHNRLNNRIQLNTICDRLLEIMNMNDTRLADLKEKHKKALTNFFIDADIISFNIEVDNKKIQYGYCSQDIVEAIKSLVSLNPTDGSSEWNPLDDKMIERLKCTLCLIELRKFLSKVPMASQGNSSLIIKYNWDQSFSPRWDLNGSDSGVVVVQYDPGPFRFGQAEKKTIRVLFRPSLLHKLFIDIKQYFNSKNTSTEITTDVTLIEKLAEEDEIDGSIEKFMKLIQSASPIHATLNLEAKNWKLDLSIEDLEELLVILEPMVKTIDIEPFKCTDTMTRTAYPLAN